MFHTLQFYYNYIAYINNVVAGNYVANILEFYIMLLLVAVNDTAFAHNPYLTIYGYHLL